MEKTWNELRADAYRNFVAPPAKPKAATPKPPAPNNWGAGIGLETWDDVACEFTNEYRDQIRYSPEREMWLLWDGHVWRWDQTKAIREIVKEYGRDQLVSGVDVRRSWGKKTLETKGINEILNLAKSDSNIAVMLEDFDADVFEVNTPGGVVDLWTGAVTPATPDKLVKRSTTVTPDSSCPTPNYERLLSQAFAGEPELSEYFETMMGVTLIKAQHEQVFMYMFGEAGSGKGTLMNIAQKILGKDENGYTTYVDSSVLVSSRNNAHPTEMMQFLGARMAITSEISEGQTLDTAKLKKITGGDTIKGRYTGKDFVSFDATHTLWLMANYRLQVPKDDKGVWRRLKTIHFKHALSSGEMIKNLDGLIVEKEGPGVLARWISRATQYLNHGFYIPDAVITANEAYQEEQDTVKLWLEFGNANEQVGSFEPFESLRDSYMHFCRRERKIAVSVKALAQALDDAGYKAGRKYVEFPGMPKKQVRGYFGLALA
jgi:putative DNA primase/helicase